MGSTQISVRWLLRRKTKDKEGLQYPGKKFLVRDRFSVVVRIIVFVSLSS